ncbi:hypothetical protein [Streptomyces luteolus]|uniref:Secreted protein n=1 Tax=Streptomyces luteolus TaxID=3043615 RepID=A0ABT6T967_9ACTN|nr:hypothetical protein [Streptomyces sp. B-S-A12]MDI3424235.1 hypothetical protein [Streptomyces sp. B-S-A12]
MRTILAISVLLLFTAPRPVEPVAFAVITTLPARDSADIPHTFLSRSTPYGIPLSPHGIGRRAWWLLPPELGDELDEVPHLTVHPASWRLACPPVLGAANGRVWLERPDGTGRLTDPTALSTALAPDSGANGGPA